MRSSIFCPLWLSSGLRFRIAYHSCESFLPRIAQLTSRESMAEMHNTEIPAEFRPLAALLVSKIYFYIGELNEAVEFALKAESAFEKEPSGEYKETIIGALCFCHPERLLMDQLGVSIGQYPSRALRQIRSWMRIYRPSWMASCGAIQEITESSYASPLVTCRTTLTDRQSASHSPYAVWTSSKCYS